MKINSFNNLRLWGKYSYWFFFIAHSIIHLNRILKQENLDGIIVIAVSALSLWFTRQISKSTYASLTDHWILTKLHCVYYVPLEKLWSMKFTVREYKDIINLYTLSSGNRNGSLHHYAKKNVYYKDIFVLTI